MYKECVVRLGYVIQIFILNTLLKRFKGAGIVSE